MANGALRDIAFGVSGSVNFGVVCLLNGQKGSRNGFLMEGYHSAGENNSPARLRSKRYQRLSIDHISGGAPTEKGSTDPWPTFFPPAVQLYPQPDSRHFPLWEAFLLL